MLMCSTLWSHLELHVCIWWGIPASFTLFTITLSVCVIRMDTDIHWSDLNIMDPRAFSHLCIHHRQMNDSADKWARHESMLIHYCMKMLCGFVQVGLSKRWHTVAPEALREKCIAQGSAIFTQLQRKRSNFSYMGSTDIFHSVTIIIISLYSNLYFAFLVMEAHWDLKRGFKHSLKGSMVVQ